MIPGFIDLHIHCDTEVEVVPTPTESLRRASPLHGSCRVGCSSSSVISKTWLTPSAGSKASSTTRCPLLRDAVNWNGVFSASTSLGTLPLGPNLVGMVRHSTIRSNA